MKASWRVEPQQLTLTLLPDDTDPLRSPKPPGLRMLTNVATVRLPSPVAEPHSDLLALAAYSVAWPWVGRKLTLDRPISLELAGAFAAAGVDAGPAAGAPRTPGRRPSLAYSGGADSIATAELLPADIPYVHLRRVKHPRVVNRMTRVRVDVIEELVREAGRRGREVLVVETDLEYLSLPHATFPVWFAIAIGSIVTADELDAGALALGTVLESRYTANGTRYVGSDVNLSTHGLFAAAGIPLLRPVAGLTEVGTTRLSMGSELGDLARSCLRGGPSGPCLRCDKCLRKELVGSAVAGTPLPAALRERMVEGAPMLAKITGPPPLYFQDMVEYALARVDVSGTPIQKVKDVLAPTAETTAWAEGYYPPALEDEVPEPFRSGVRARLAGRVELMDAAQTAVIETWDAVARWPKG